MRRGLIIFFAVMALIFSVVLCACEKDTTTPNGGAVVDPNADLTELVSEAGVVVGGAKFPAGTTLVCNEITDEDALAEINQSIANQDSLVMSSKNGWLIEIVKAIDVSIYSGDEKWNGSGSLNYTIPCEVFGINNLPNSYNYAFFRINKKNIAKYIDAYGRINSVGFNSVQPKYIVLVKYEECPCKHENCSFCEASLATMIYTGRKAYHYCYDCNKYLDENMKETTYEDLEIPRLSRVLDLYVNGEKKATFEDVVEGEHLTLYWELTGVSLKAGDSIAIVSQDEEPVTYTIEPKYETNIDKNCKIRSDVESATLKLLYNALAYDYETQKYSGTMQLSVSGINYYYFGNVDRPSLIWDYIEDSRDNGIISFNNVSPDSSTYAMYYRTDDGLTKIEDVTFTKSEATSAVSVNTGSMRFNKCGLYNITYNTNTKTAEISVIETSYDMFWCYEWEGQRKSFGYFGYRKIDGKLSRYTDITSLFVQNVGDKISFYDHEYSTSALGVMVSENSKDYIKYNEDDKSVEFLQNGVYRLEVNYYNREIIAIRTGNLAYEYRAYFSPSNSDVASPTNLVKTQNDNIYEYSPDFLIYPGDEIWIDNKYDSVHDYYELADSSDTQYACEIGNRELRFEKGGMYKIIFNAETKEIDLELIRELTEDEALIPTKLVLFIDMSAASETQYNLVENPENEDELYAVITIETDRSYIDDYVKNYVKFIDKDKRHIANFSIDTALAEKACICKTRVQNSIYFYKAGKYIVYINKTTYAVRVEEVVAA